MSAPDDEQTLFAKALEARKFARCSYSHFAVGVAILDGAGNIWTGANVENASYTLGLCAERVAIFYALTHGAKAFSRIVVASEATCPAPPCGGCRQILWEYAATAEVVAINGTGTIRRWSVPQLLPDPFGPLTLEPNR